jgi:hypothetical protein
MSELSDDELRKLAIKAVQDLVGAHVAIDVQIADDRLLPDYPACFLSIRISDEFIPEIPESLFWIKMLDTLHARLEAAGDSRYPHFGRFGFYPVSQLERA